ncbi:hypothetical protein O3G_MSEX003667 [Manduca sexta]|uniref:Uncharacterized protein n=1 Tax=Manduca sexta TaxID=7130 RepID=A0A921YUN6_MANSE|nr:hypothetical protein O3G_MSEX003667 [Manduca sexta]
MAQLNHVTVEIEEEEAEEVTPRHNNLQRGDSVTRPAAPNRNNLGLGDRLNSVFREIRPLVEHARMGNNARLSLPTWLPRNPPGTHQIVELGLQRPQSSIAHVNLGPNAQTYIVTDRVPPPVQRTQSAGNAMSNSASNNSNLSDQETEHPEINVSVNPANNNNIRDNVDNDSQSDDGSQQVVDVRATLNFLIRYAPFYFLLFIKFMYDCREGIFTFIILFCTFIHSNSLVRREHGKQMNRSIFSLFSELFFTIVCIITVHCLFGHGQSVFIYGSCVATVPLVHNDTAVDILSDAIVRGLREDGRHVPHIGLLNC